MKREERNEFNYIRKSLREHSKHSPLGSGTQLTIRTDRCAEYKKALHDLYTSYGFHPCSVNPNPWPLYDHVERIIYIYGLTWDDADGIPQSWDRLYSKEEKAKFAKALE